MAKQRVMVIGGGLAGLAATMKLAELGIDVDLMSLTPVKRSHSVCAQGGINSCNDQTRQLGDIGVEALRRHGLRRRLPAAPAAGQGDGLLGAARSST